MRRPRGVEPLRSREISVEGTRYRVLRSRGLLDSESTERGQQEGFPETDFLPLPSEAGQRAEEDKEEEGTVTTERGDIGMAG
jgi:hypothetical protein